MTQVVMLGTGTPNADAKRVSSGVAIAINNQPYLVDCGHGIVQRVVEAHQSGKISWNSTHLNRLFVTHLHADHIVGLPDLMFTPWIHDRQTSIQAYGPPELASMVEHINLAFSENIREHTTAHPHTPHGYKVEVFPVLEGLCYQDENVQVFALKADHGDLTAYSYKFVSPDRTVIISGDTRPVPEFVQWARGCDVLIHEVYSALAFNNRPAEWQAYHSRVHTSSYELGEIAHQIQPKRLVLYHQLFWGVSETDLIAEVATRFDGKIISANDLDIV